MSSETASSSARPKAAARGPEPGRTGRRSPGLRRLFVPSLASLLFAFVLLGGVLGPKASGFLSGDGDLALHVVLGDLVWRSGGVLATEPTTFTADDRPFIAHEWGSEVLLSLSHAALGLAGPLLLVALVVATTFGVLLRSLRAAGVSPWVQVALAVGVLAIANHHLVVRPHVVTWLLSLVWTLRLERVRRGELTARAWLLGAAPLIVLWTNLHGGFVLGFVLLGLYGGAALLDALFRAGAARAHALAQLRRLAGLGLIVLALSGINPFGFRLHLHIVEFMGQSTILASVAEFASPDFHEPHQRVFLAWALGVLTLLVLGRERPATVEWLLPLALFAQSLFALRNEPLFAILSAPIAARRLDALLRDATRGDAPVAALARALQASSERLRASDRRAGGAATLVLLVLGLTGLLALRGRDALDFDPTRQPVEAVAFVEAHPERFRGRMFNSYGWGGFVSYRLFPEHKTFVNGFNDHYGPALFETYLTVATLRPGWREILDAHGVDWVLFESDAPLTRALLADPDWEPVHRDPLATILVRAGTAPRRADGPAPGPPAS